MSEWITDRKPTAEDADTGCVWVTTKHGVVLLKTWDMVFGRPWQPIVPPEPYVKAKRYVIKFYGDFGIVGPAGYACVYYTPSNLQITGFLPREAAERIAAIYEEFMP